MDGNCRLSALDGGISAKETGETGDRVHCWTRHCPDRSFEALRSASPAQKVNLVRDTCAVHATATLSLRRPERKAAFWDAFSRRDRNPATQRAFRELSSVHGRLHGRLHGRSPPLSFPGRKLVPAEKKRNICSSKGTKKQNGTVPPQTAGAVVKLLCGGGTQIQAVWPDANCRRLRQLNAVKTRRGISFSQFQTRSPLFSGCQFLTAKN